MTSDAMTHIRDILPGVLEEIDRCAELSSRVKAEPSEVRFPQIIDHDPARVGAWMQAQGAGYWREGCTCIGLERHGELVAGTLYDYCNGASVFANIAIAGPITKTWLWYIFYYPFEQLGVQTLIGLIEPQNVKSQRLAQHFGFTELTGIPDGAPQGDLLLYVMQKAQCRFLKGRYGETLAPSIA